MSQYDFGVIDPNVRDGTWLANALNNWRTALYSIHRGPTRPSYAVPGQMWISDAGGAAAWRLKQFVGGSFDIDILIINTVTGVASLALPINVGANGGLVAANNLSDVPNDAAARTNLGLGALATAAQVNGSQIALAAQAQGALMYLNAGVWTPVPAGVAGQRLRSNGTTAPTWVHGDYASVFNNTEMGFVVGGPLAIALPSETADPNGWWNPGTNILTLPTSGIFAISLQTQAGAYGTYGNIQVSIMRVTGNAVVASLSAGTADNVLPLTVQAIVAPVSGNNGFYFQAQATLQNMRLFGAQCLVWRIS